MVIILIEGSEVMRRIISLIVLLIVLIIGVEFLVTRFTKNYESNYIIYKDKLEFKINEKYSKDNGNSYIISISNENNNFYYSINNTFNKQKKIITDILYFNNGNDICIYPVLKNKEKSYIECSSNNNLYTMYTYHDPIFIKSIISTLNEKGITIGSENVLKGKKVYGNLTFYDKNIKDTDTILMWQYKGIYYMNKDNQTNIMSLTFDKYDNKLGVLVGKYYLIPEYKNSKILEFSSYNVIDLESLGQKTMDLNYILSSDTYINGVVDNKLYVTDPRNFRQYEINPKKRSIKLIGDTEIGGKLYDGTWKDANIYDFASSEIKFENKIDVNYNYIDIKEGGSSYYYYTSDGSIYQLIKGYLDKPILIYRQDSLNNFNVISNDLYFVANNTLYSFNLVDGVKDIIYNTTNRISIFRR